MSSHDTLIACRRCRKESQMRDMKYDPNGEDLICPTCAADTEKVSIYDEEDEPLPRRMTRKSPQQDMKEESRSRYYCISCRYIFSRNKDVSVELCPYCSKPTLRKYAAKSSDDLLQEAHQSPFD